MKRLFSCLLAAALCLAAAAQPARRYCNPLPMPIGPGGNASGDVSVLFDGGKYYMFCTGGGAWVSEDLANWDFHAVEHVPVAPDVVKYRGRYYMTGNDCPVYVADSPLGPYSVLGEWKNTSDLAHGWNGAFDTHIFIDDDGQPYLFWPGRGVSGIYGVKLDPDDLTRFASEPVHLFSFNPMHAWERYGEMNEYPGVAWIEGPWVIKRNGVYYLEYSASGTQWRTYAEGYYTAKSPLGPYEYAPNNPLLRKTDGLVTGTAHGSIVKGPDGDWWQFYTIVLSNPPGGRRIGMDRVRFDADGYMSVEVTETPQPVPGSASAPVSIPVTINKMVAMNALSSASSAQDGYPAAYAVDNFSGTLWRPAADDKAPSLTVELSPATRFDVVQLFEADAVRILFGGGGRRFYRNAGLPVYKYRLEVSMDGKEFTTVVDKTRNETPRDTDYVDFAPVRCRFVRLTVTGWPAESPLGIIDFTVFGRPAGDLPAAVPIPTI